MSALEGKVDIPGVGATDKRIVIGIGGAAALYLGYRWYSARSSASYDPTQEATDPGMEDPGTLPAVDGAVSPTNSYGLADGSSSSGTSTDSYGFTGTTNSQWTQYALTQLSQASDSWSYGTIVTALGNFINNKPLSTTQQQIVQAAIAVAGYPPEGSHVIIPGGDATITVAPTSVKVTGQTSTTVSLSWGAVAGADGYRLYRSGVSQVVGTANGTSGTVGGLSPNTSYSFQVAAYTGAGKVGPKSSSVKGKTSALAMKAPTSVRVSSIAATAATVSWHKTAGATEYRVFANGALKATTRDASSARITGLSKKTRYRVTVKAYTNNQTSPDSAAATFTTKSK